MNDRPAGWQMPSTKEMEKLAGVGGKAVPARPVGPGDEMPPEYWDAVLTDACADARASGRPAYSRRLSEVPHHLLRVSCWRCGRIVEIQKADAVRLYGAQAVWKEVGKRMLDDTCQQRSGRYEEDGCWPSYDAS
jgi:hypothetical protein